MMLLIVSLLTILTFCILLLIFSPKIKLSQMAKKYKDTEVLFSPVGGIVNLYQQSFEKYGDALYFIRDLIQKKPNTQAILYNLGLDVVVNFQDAELVKEVHQSYSDYYEKLKGILTLQYLFDKGMLMTDGDEWQKQRKLLANTFLFQNIKSRLPVTKQVVQEIYSSKHLDLSKPINALHMSEKVTSDVIFQTFFGISFRGKKINGVEIQKELSNVLIEGFNYIQSSFYYKIKMVVLKEKAVGFKPFKGEEELLKRMKNLRDATQEVIQNRLKQIKDSNLDISQSELFLDILLRDYIQKNSESEKDIQQMIDQFMTFFFGGTDTTADLVALTLYHLSHNQNFQTKLRSEIKSIINNFEELNYDNLNQMNYLQCVIKESLRIHPPAVGVLPRVCIKDHKVGQIEMKKGMLMDTHFIGVLNNPKYYDNPQDFNPDRWNDSKKMESAPFSPFGIGKRSCIGQHLGMMNAKVIVCYLIMNYLVKPNHKQKLRMSLNTVYTPFNDDLVYFEKIN
ncbi:hypothetical protein ABPG74_014082 [Tetrahymena malaccensis]